MAEIQTLFVTRIYRAEIASRGAGRRLNDELKAGCLSIAADDAAGQAWCAANGYKGYTSYASLDDLAWRSPVFADLIAVVDPHVAELAKAADLDLGRRKLVADSIWINVLEPGGHHSAHIHPQSVISGTYYVEVPPGASAIRFEDPRLAMMMAAPPRRARASRESQTFVSVAPKVGTLLLWESWLRHEVPVNTAESERISVSFNYRAE
ncbi:MAG: TIGR02466 family protein [Hyphomicrobiaceae bacterium]|nr:TIGR02466 family protein [Hyphomicrobiaceae bacterium]